MTYTNSNIPPFLYKQQCQPASTSIQYNTTHAHYEVFTNISAQKYVLKFYELLHQYCEDVFTISHFFVQKCLWIAQEFRTAHARTVYLCLLTETAVYLNVYEYFYTPETCHVLKKSFNCTKRKPRASASCQPPPPEVVRYTYTHVVLILVTNLPTPAPRRISSSHSCSTHCRSDPPLVPLRGANWASRTSPTWSFNSCIRSSTPWRCPSRTWRCNRMSKEPTPER